jgi:bifunctional non-homologous end joining protein LigD
MATARLGPYNRKRNFDVSPEPPGKAGATRGAGRFVVQKHAARNLHYDFRLEWQGVLLSWAVPKGPSLDPAVKRMAVQVEDHPLAYGDFEGVIPEGHYGAGSVIVWDTGTWHPLGDAARGLREGKLKFRLDGTKLKGGFTLVRMRSRDGERQPAWLLIKENDAAARASTEFDVVAEQGDSVLRPKTRSKAMSQPTVKPGKAVRAKKPAPLPPLIAPQLATLVSTAPTVGDWQYELKLDGYRLLVRADGRDVRCFTRSGHDWSDRLPSLVTAIRQLKLPPCWLDGELVALDDESVPDFQRLQKAFEPGSAAQLRYIVFDLLFAGGKDLRELGQQQRREKLSVLLARKKSGMVRFSETLDGDPKRLLAAARAAGFEGLMGKRADATYQSGRSRDWVKLKAGLRQEFVIGGYTDPQGSREGLGSLLLGVHDDKGALRYVGNVGSGFDQHALGTLRARLDRLAATRGPFEHNPKRVGTTRKVPHWVKPKLVAEVSFAGWTTDKHLRQAVFHGLRDDKPAGQISMEKTGTPAGEGKRPRARKSQPDRALAAMRITHPDRVIDPDSGVTKGDLIAYYSAVAPLLLPHLKDRPVSLLRAPSGVAGTKFFQKHAEARSLPELKRLPRSLDPGHQPLLAITAANELLSAGQMNVVELHTWNATTRAIDKPDRLILDLDPGADVGWSAVREAAQLVHALLEELELASFLKTSGGKGLHVVLPLKPQLGWDEVKQFSGDMVRHLARILPQRFVAKSGPANRVGRVFVDYLRNGRGATTVAAWSARARPGMGISVPLAWSEVAGFKSPPAWSVANHSARLAIGNTPWNEYERSRQSLTRARKALAAIRKG